MIDISSLPADAAGKTEALNQRIHALGDLALDIQAKDFGEVYQVIDLISDKINDMEEMMEDAS